LLSHPFRMHVSFGTSQGFTLRSNPWLPSFFPFGEEATKSVSTRKFEMRNLRFADAQGFCECLFRSAESAMDNSQG
jgi:hypothetical protein